MTAATVPTPRANNNVTAPRRIPRRLTAPMFQPQSLPLFHAFRG